MKMKREYSDKEVIADLQKWKDADFYSKVYSSIGSAAIICEIVIEECDEVAEHRKIARGNLITNIVSSLEVFLKKAMVDNRGKWNKDGIKELLKDKKMSMSEVFQFLRHSKDIEITEEQIIADSYSFTNVDSIAHIFNKLTGREFLKELINYPSTKKLDFYDLINIPEWEKHLRDLYNIRNGFTHEQDLNLINEEISVDFYRQISFGFVLATGNFFETQNFNQTS